MAKASGAISFSGGFLDGEVRGWREEWPPPEHLVAARSKSGTTSVAAPGARLDEILPDLLRECWVVRYARLRSLDDVPRVALYGYDGALSRSGA